VTETSNWQYRSPLAGEKPWSTAASAGGAAPGVTIREHVPGLVLGIVAFRGKAVEIGAALREATGLEVPVSPRIASNQGTAIVWSGPSQWLVLADTRTAAAITQWQATLDRLGAVSDQSAARVFLRMAGGDVRRALAKVLGIDLHPLVFPVGHAAMTDLAHLPVHVWRTADIGAQATFEIAGPRSMAGSLWHALLAAAAEYGLDARPAA
jgi:methylglutamate dehydrogenase subunit D